MRYIRVDLSSVKDAVCQVDRRRVGFVECHEVGKDLRRVPEVGQGVDDRYRGMFGEFLSAWIRVDLLQLHDGPQPWP